MAPTVTAQLGARHLERLEPVRPTMAKADLKNLERPWRARVGTAIQRCFSLAGLSQKEAAALLNRDPGQVGRWISGDERPQLDALFAVDVLRQPLVIALAALAGEGVEIKTVVEIRRVA